MRQLAGLVPAARRTGLRGVLAIGGVAAQLTPGVALSGAIACAAILGSQIVRVPAAVLALVLGVGFAAVVRFSAGQTGLQFTARPVLRLAVGLLGAQVSLTALGQLGPGAFAAASVTVLVTFLLGIACGRSLGLSSSVSMISAGAVAICGASAALAIAAVLPPDQHKERHTLAVVAGVNVLSTFAMLFYPLLGDPLGLSHNWLGAFFGLSIHDVAQVAAAGISVSPEAAASAAAIKLARVACLAPIVIAVGVLTTRGGADLPADSKRPPLVPWFLWLFVGLAVARNLGILPNWLIEALVANSTFLLVACVGAIGALVAPRDVLKTPRMLFVHLVALTCFIAAFSAGATYYLQQAATP